MQKVCLNRSIYDTESKLVRVNDVVQTTVIIAIVAGIQMHEPFFLLLSNTFRVCSLIELLHLICMYNSTLVR